jgi:hypothetical protein
MDDVAGLRDYHDNLLQEISVLRTKYATDFAEGTLTPLDVMAMMLPQPPSNLLLTSLRDISPYTTADNFIYTIQEGSSN